jgi:hypothetical protein
MFVIVCGYVMLSCCRSGAEVVMRFAAQKRILRWIAIAKLRLQHILGSDQTIELFPTQ